MEIILITFISDYMGQFNDNSTVRSRQGTETLISFYRECTIFVIPASQVHVERLSVSKIVFCICPVLSPSVEKCG